MAGSNELIPSVQGATVTEQPSPISRDALRAQIGSGIKLSDDQRRQLVVDAGDNIINIKPTGEVYVPGVHWRTILNQVFDPFGWGIMGGAPQLDLHEKGNRDDQGKSTMYREVYLIISRCTRCYRSMNACQCGGPYAPFCVNTAMGAQEYHPTNSRLALDDAAEGALTNGLMRCCKTFGIYDNVWNPVAAEGIKYRIGVKVNVVWSNGTRKEYWRLLESQPLPDEAGVAADSPNREAYLERFGKAPAKPPAAPQAQRPAPSKARTAGSSDAPQVKPAAADDKILVIRLVTHSEGKYWVINLDPSGEYITDDPQMVLQLENAKVRGWRIVVEDTEMVRSSKGQRKKLVTYRLVEAGK